jgi:hypothetical protein
VSRRFQPVEDTVQQGSNRLGFSVGQDGQSDLDVHQKSVGATTVVDAEERTYVARGTFGTMTSDLMTLLDWLTAQGGQPGGNGGHG